MMSLSMWATLMATRTFSVVCSTASFSSRAAVASDIGRRVDSGGKSESYACVDLSTTAEVHRACAATRFDEQTAFWTLGLLGPFGRKHRGRPKSLWIWNLRFEFLR